jgi:tetratricopeptide (TPR) repeat protein
MRLTLAAAALALAGCAQPTVVRMVDGQPVAGRFIEERAYALYAYAAEAEAHGDHARAAKGYAMAAEVDAESPEIWTRLGAVRCKIAPDAAPQAFERAEMIDASYAPLHRERARCLLARGHTEEAIAEAERAVAEDPDDVEASEVRAMALAQAGRIDEGILVMRGVVARRPRATGAWLVLAALSKVKGDEAMARQAAARVAALDPLELPWAQKRFPEFGPLPVLDAALRADDLTAARRLAGKAKQGYADLAARAAALGRAATARAQAELVLGADPADATARVALATAADLAGDPAALAAALRDLPSRSVPLTPLARLLLGELLARRVGDAAARAFLGDGWEALPTAGDTLLQATLARLQSRLGAARATPR